MPGTLLYTTAVHAHSRSLLQPRPTPVLVVVDQQEDHGIAQETEL